MNRSFFFWPFRLSALPRDTPHALFYQPQFGPKPTPIPEPQPRPQPPLE
ncbi:hypothetical protein SAMN05443245_2243 [Paraburkholderia fungorum]|uniref:Uncharacterized protein n=1 Tax=Paraburkholderia fungorum TaxID=134537 RepID=A0A1H1CNQ2_9BURK|nr:hypothetical protein SAMN05443245_2243 [Paraburkholderia fungorum]